MRCARGDEMEELVLGLLSAEQANSAREHAAECEWCAAELVRFRRQRELFVQRAKVAQAEPLGLPELFKRIQVEERNRFGARVLRLPAALGAMAAAACAVLALRAWGPLPLALLAQGDRTHTPTDLQEDPTWERPAVCVPKICNQTTSFASDCELQTCWQPTASAAIQESLCSQPVLPFLESARCETDPFATR